MVARGPAGEIVMGFDLGKMPETVSELGGALASTFLGPQMGSIVGTGLALFLGGGAATYGVAKERGRKKADQSREKSDKELVALRGLLKGMGIIKDTPTPSPEGDTVESS